MAHGRIDSLGHMTIYDYDLSVIVESGCSTSPLLWAGPQYQEKVAVKVLEIW